MNPLYVRIRLKNKIVGLKITLSLKIVNIFFYEGVVLLLTDQS